MTRKNIVVFVRNRQKEGHQTFVAAQAPQGITPQERTRHVHPLPRKPVPELNDPHHATLTPPLPQDTQINYQPTGQEYGVQADVRGRMSARVPRGWYIVPSRGWVCLRRGSMRQAADAHCAPDQELLYAGCGRVDAFPVE